MSKSAPGTDRGKAKPYRTAAIYRRAAAAALEGKAFETMKKYRMAEEYWDIAYNFDSREERCLAFCFAAAEVVLP